MKFGDLRGILQYVPQFRDKLFIIHLEGSVVGSDNFSNVVLDLAVLYSLGVRFVIVHGADQQIRDLYVDRNGDELFLDSDKPTGRDLLEISIEAVSRVTNTIVRELTAVGLKVASANAIIARQRGVIKGVDYPLDGKVEKVDEDCLCDFLERGMVPILTPIGFDDVGDSLVMNEDSLVFAVGEYLGANKVIMLTKDQSIATSSGVEYSVSEARSVTKNQCNLSDRVNLLLRKAAQACEEGVERVHILDGLRDYAILAELFSNEGVGVMVHRDPYGEIRQAKNSDVAEILSIIRGAVMGSDLLPRHSADIFSCIEDYFILEIDSNVVGTVAVHACEGFVELACLFVKRNHEGAGYGTRLVAHAEKITRELGVGKLYALSTQATGFFEKLEWRDGDLEDLPIGRAEQLKMSGRNSKIYFKLLA
ncbi:amino-acid N-acetyltransferase [Verrucomicrobia bacterium]|nr:amino-acid N-acetyltransferase [Verrucomicrobiota bacterium]